MQQQVGVRPRPLPYLPPVHCKKGSLTPTFGCCFIWNHCKEAGRPEFIWFVGVDFPRAVDCGRPSRGAPLPRCSGSCP